LKSDSRELHHLSRVTGSWDNKPGHGDRPYDSFESAALIDIRDTKHDVLIFVRRWWYRNLVLAESHSGVDIINFDLTIDGNGLDKAEFEFTIEMVSDAEFNSYE
jgi:hypothetical protein